MGEKYSYSGLVVSSGMASVETVDSPRFSLCNRSGFGDIRHSSRPSLGSEVQEV